MAVPQCEDANLYEFLTKKLHENEDPAAVTEIYDQWTSYDKEVKQMWYAGPKNLAKVVDKYVQNKECSIVDVGAGTGLAAEELRKAGFTGRFDAIEPSTGLLKEAELKGGLYQKLYTEYVTVEKPCSIPTGFYDHAVTCGAIVPGHIPYQALSEMLRMVKKDGCVFACFRKNYLDFEQFQGFNEFLEKIQSEGKCTYDIIEIDEYCFSLPGLIIVLKKTC
ncbi:methyltransferase-like protein 27 [Tubulanus polymorphus]|uniref:methyltransferase-like protein 27 n=1 Tax=Tubulanus polymorphus TaxID=672921 RepID=UPI003DA69631